VGKKKVPQIRPFTKKIPEKKPLTLKGLKRNLGIFLYFRLKYTFV